MPLSSNLVNSDTPTSDPLYHLGDYVQFEEGETLTGVIVTYKWVGHCFNYGILLDPIHTGHTLSGLLVPPYNQRGWWVVEELITKVGESENYLGFAKVLHDKALIRDSQQNELRRMIDREWATMFNAATLTPSPLYTAATTPNTFWTDSVSTTTIDFENIDMDADWYTYDTTTAT